MDDSESFFLPTATAATTNDSKLVTCVGGFCHQRSLKGSKEFQGEEERMIFVSNIKAVDHAILSVDEDRTVCATLEKIADVYGQDYDLAFANGGDQNNDTIPERPICEKMGIVLIDGLGEKFNRAVGCSKSYKN